MKLTDKHIHFLEKFKQKYPDFEVVSFSKINKPMVVKDTYGVLYKKNNAHRFLSKNISFESVVHKEQYIQDRLDSLNTGLTLISYTGMKDKVVVKDQNGFTYSPQCYDLLRGHVVSIETCNQKEDLFRYKARKKHNNKYDYGDFVYVNGRQKVPVLCPVHGRFLTKIESHLSGNGCAQCKRDNASFSRKKWIDRFKDRECIFYVLEFYNDRETFIKVGVTAVSIRKRYYGSLYKYRQLLKITGPSWLISDLENEALTKYKYFRYTPMLKFEGRTECFSSTIKQNIHEQFKPYCPRW